MSFFSEENQNMIDGHKRLFKNLKSFLVVEGRHCKFLTLNYQFRF